MCNEGFFQILVSGDRSFHDYEMLERPLDKLLNNIQDEILVICGMSGVAEPLAELYAKLHDYGILYYPTDSDNFGERAEEVRNLEMVNAADAAVLFWNGIDPETQNMINLVLQQRVRARVRKY